MLVHSAGPFMVLRATTRTRVPGTSTTINKYSCTIYYYYNSRSTIIIIIARVSQRVQARTITSIVGKLVN